MDTTMTECKQDARNQYIALTTIILGLISVGIGCSRHWAELTAGASGVIGAGINMLTNQIRNTLNAKQGGTVNVGDQNPPPVPATS